MEHIISEFRLKLIIELAAELGAIGAFIESGHMKPYLNKSEVVKLYGRRCVKKWIETGLVIPIKDGSHSASYRFERMEIETLIKCTHLLKILLMDKQ